MKLSRLLLFFILSVGVAHSALEVTVVKKDENAFPIAISKFQLIGKGAHDKDISKIIHDNLTRSGRFSVLVPNATVESFKPEFWKQQNIEALVFGTIKQESSELYRLTFVVYDVYSNAKLLSQSTLVSVSGFRKVAHQISDSIYEILLGENGSFNTLLTYITVKKGESSGKKIYQLNISDADAKNAKSRVKHTSPMLSPVWSPDRRYKDKKIAYVSFENGRSEVFVWYPFVNKKIQRLPHFDGLASSPSWHPNGKSLLMTMSYKGNKDIYEYNLETKRFIRWTKHKGIDTEASYSADGKYIVFTSDRSGQPQVYIRNLKTNRINRVSFAGRYNAKATFSPDGKQLALVHRVDNDYRIALLNTKTNELTVISNGTLDESPHFSPNGDMIVFSSNHRGTGVLSVVSVEGNRSYELSSHNAEVREPNWSTHLQQ
ncbi:Tol-Pal system beta propeller repeat protein TolB [Bathymodiolus septemdierum thioautotrophic gill symbiont]|uniref:Tol-Pal system protein TolB n=1 Tax=endosymbiont of Bathymodiolus septemdierum str. Myojin knoll TaxID=1303921 RepID=A0A0P0URQ0_9GAMM|nr:Tol-Pal system beta propeller repeat protein TolB [Bathymodiolus septemdierum thioautotrophic gill symbiont]BAS67928.1 TolB protein [endosymbiont of Bathymodiolus septemdierum str. Myojin knoll]